MHEVISVGSYEFFLFHKLAGLCETPNQSGPRKTDEKSKRANNGDLGHGARNTREKSSKNTIWVIFPEPACMLIVFTFRTRVRQQTRFGLLLLISLI